MGVNIDDTATELRVASAHFIKISVYSNLSKMYGLKSPHH